MFAACGGDDDASPGPGDSGAGGAGGAPGKAGSAGATMGSAGAAGAAGALGCERFGFVASGVSCAATGCASFGCSCPDDFPRSLASCSPDGCLVAADCTALCAADNLGDALDCTDTYTVAPTQGSGGAGGSAGAMPMPTCSPADVRVPPASATTLGTAPLRRTSVLADDAGALYIAGGVPSGAPVDLGGGELPAGRGMVVFKLDAARQHVWSRRLGSEFGPNDVSIFSFAPNGDLLVGGVTWSEPDFGGGPDPASDVVQLFVARYDRSGNFLRRFLLPMSNVYSLPTGLVELPTGDTWVFGNFNDALPLGSTTLTSAGESDIFALRFSAAGAVVEAKRFGRSRNDIVYAAAGGPDGSAYLTGFSFFAVDFGQNPVELGTNSSSWVVRLDATLKPVWQKLVGGGSSYPRRAFLDGAALVVAGDAAQEFYYGDSATGSLPKGNLFLLRVDTSNGALLQGRTYEPEGFGAQVTALGRMPGGGVAVGGYVRPPADFGGGPLTSVGGYQPFVARYDADGQHLWSTLFCTNNVGADAVAGVASDGDSAVLLVPFGESLELGSGRFTGGPNTALVDMPPE